jgi:hypothetical protein
MLVIAGPTVAGVEKASARVPSVAPAVASLSAGAIQGAKLPRDARPRDVSLKVTLLTKDGTISAYEPLLARIVLRNRSAESICVVLGNNGAPGTHLAVCDDEGKLLAETRTAEADQEGALEWLEFLRQLGPGDSHSRVRVVTGLYEFRTAGKYLVRVQQLGHPEGRRARGPGDLTVLAEDEASVRVLPFNAARLEAACEELFQPLRKRSSAKTDIPVEIRRKALYSVRHDIVLPYLDWLAREGGGAYAVVAMRRIGTERAKKLVNALAARRDSIGAEARRGLRLSLDTGF